MVSRLCNGLAAAALAAAILVPPTASALESPWADAGTAKVRLLAAGSPLRAGVEIRLPPGWHTYWRYPGDAGVPPRFDWSGSKNLAGTDVRWPAPERIAGDGGLESIGYHGTVILPIRVRAADPSKPVALRLHLHIGVCEKICIPAEARLTLDLPAAFAERHPALDAAERRVPPSAPPGKGDGLGVLAVKLERGKEPRALVEVAVPAGQPFDLFAEGPTDNWALPLPKRIAAGDGRARFEVALDGAPAGAGPTPSALRLTLVSGERAVEVLTPLD